MDAGLRDVLVLVGRRQPDEPNRRYAARKLSASAAWTQPSRCGSDAAYAAPSGARPRTRSWMPRTMATAASASSAVPNVVRARNAEVRCSRPQGSDRYPECPATPAIASGCSDWRSSARIPPTNIDASSCTRQTGRSR